MLTIFVFFSVISMILVECFAVALLNVVIRRETVYLLEERIKMVVHDRKDLVDSANRGVQACPSPDRTRTGRSISWMMYGRKTR
jgi:hypothetical protein